MAGVKWEDINDRGRTWSMRHLHPQIQQLGINGITATLEISFGFHVFTDQKAAGCKLRFRHEERFFCPERYDGSRTIVSRIVAAVEKGEYVTAFITRVHGQRYYHLSTHQDFILMEIRRPPGTENFLRLHIVTAYTLDEWGSLNRGKNLKLRYVLEQRLLGKAVL